MPSRPYILVGVYDTETTTLRLENGELVAFPCLYIYNDISGCDLCAYTENDGDIHFYRYLSEMIGQIQACIERGKAQGYVPIVCAYNLMFDLQPLMQTLACAFEIEVNAQSGTNVYTLDLCEKGQAVLRFWDTFHLENRGLAAMGDACGLKKAYGDWDYSLIRHAETPLTEEEKHYAACDVRIIPMYLCHLLKLYDWLTPDMFGVQVVTKTSLVRQMAKRTFKNIYVKTGKHKRGISLEKCFMELCSQEAPKSFEQYCLRKACFRGGFTFTSCNHAMQLHENTISLDAVSMHHTFIVGRYVPVCFRDYGKDALNIMCKQVLNTSLKDVLAAYHKPFPIGLHVCVNFQNIRLKANSPYESNGIGLLAASKFGSAPQEKPQWGENEAGLKAETVVREQGFHDYAVNPVFAFSKLMSAESCTVFVTELELWNIGRVYDFDSFECLSGEATNKFVKPPDYVTLQSCLLFETKQQAKALLGTYTEGKSYTGEFPELLPKNLCDEMRNGTASKQVLQSWYTQSIKGMFNSIYGTQAQDVFKPRFEYSDDLGIHAGGFSKETFDEVDPTKSKVLYTYGMRIVGGSRMHLLIALELISSACDVMILSGDTDSLKIALCDEAPESIKAALKPLEDATGIAVAYTLKRVHSDYPSLASDMDKVGTFDIEETASGVAHAYQYDGWNKCRVTFDNDGTVSVTCAGLSRPKGTYTIENWFHDMVEAGYDLQWLCECVFGFNATILNSVCHSLERTHPEYTDYIDTEVTDYSGASARVVAPLSVALYESDRELNDVTKKSVSHNYIYLKRLGKSHKIERTFIGQNDGKPFVRVESEYGGYEYRYG